MSNPPRTKILHHLQRKMPRFPGERDEQPSTHRGRYILRRVLAVGVLFVTLFAIYPLIERTAQRETVTPAGTVTACDTLAAHPADTQKLAVGVSQDQLNVTAARTACERSLAKRPNDGRTLYQLSRTYFAGKEYAAGLDLLRKSADAGYAQGQFTLAMLLLQDQSQAAKVCEGGQLLIKAARQRHFYSKVELGTKWMDGTFQDCALEMSDAEIAQMISAANELAATTEQKHDLHELTRRWESR